ncbi:uncharacterized protein UV8b_03304 [Ustilaginoidea virens]|uniref:Uncharacterized protein n=1 Tax=Ustilaginoidea virens TaxID=1159556 RepID=A0A8E5HPH3_USTVR|nr:uncharacterized protein UV8b_03304 [Ustilaginoidea virens]QUC19063.1 hypothetical protein UV8b_03304 [Ustilaginoidea virens]
MGAGASRMSQWRPTYTRLGGRRQKKCANRGCLQSPNAAAFPSLRQGVMMPSLDRHWPPPPPAGRC